ncbi:MAG: hypothetical protein IJP70_03825 [Bacteroidales bacterium]|nr:hypothetical protein [Bacteroidales bacterium]
MKQILFFLMLLVAVPAVAMSATEDSFEEAAATDSVGQQTDEVITNSIGQGMYSEKIL